MAAALVSFAFSLADEEIFKFNRDLCFGGVFSMSGVTQRAAAPWVCVLGWGSVSGG